jgi:hypothetical protein
MQVPGRESLKLPVESRTGGLGIYRNVDLLEIRKLRL